MEIVFRDKEEPERTKLTVYRFNDTVILCSNDTIDDEIVKFHADKKTLHNLIGQLLRIQSEFKKEVNNG